MTVPCGIGIGPTQAANVTMSPARAAGRLPIITVADPFEMRPGPPGTQLGIMQGWLMLVATAAGMLLISTVGTVAPTMGSGIGGGGGGAGGPGGRRGGGRGGGGPAAAP